jgi:hypothetical protein
MSYLVHMTRFHVANRQVQEVRSFNVYFGVFQFLIVILAESEIAKCS